MVCISTVVQNVVLNSAMEKPQGSLSFCQMLRWKTEEKLLIVTSWSCTHSVLLAMFHTGHI